MIGTRRTNLGGTAAGENKPPDCHSSSFEITAPASSDPRIPLLNLSLLGQKMDSLRRFLSDSVSQGVPIGDDQLQFFSGEIASAVHQIILNGSALLASTRLPDIAPPSHTVSQIDVLPSTNPDPPPPLSLPVAIVTDAEAEIVEIDAVELMAEHVHFCEICGKGFRRDANLRMHMRAHGDRFKTLESLTKPDGRIVTGGICRAKQVQFSCPFISCRRNRNHARFRALKTAVCVRNHFRRSHCPKMYTCDVCNNKSFSVLADLKSHRKSCGESHWPCSCGTSFSRKDKLFGHITLFEGHFPAVGAGEEKGKVVVISGERNGMRGRQTDGSLDEGFFDGVMEEIGGMRGGWMGL